MSLGLSLPFCKVAGMKTVQPGGWRRASKYKHHVWEGYTHKALGEDSLGRG